jgi:hypothetical protein
MARDEIVGVSDSLRWLMCKPDVIQRGALLRCKDGVCSAVHYRISDDVKLQFEGSQSASKSRWYMLRDAL